MKYYFPIHLNGGNRGCEAIAKGTAQVLGASKEDMIGYCSDVSLDHKLGIDKYYTLIPFKKTTSLFKLKNRVHSLFVRDNEKRLNYVYSYQYDDFLKEITDDDIMFSTGGDMFCYANCQVNYTVDYLAARNKKTVLWGCSIGEKNLTPEKIVSLHNFTAVVARESLTLKLFETMGLKKVFLLPDPAFSLEAEPCELPEYMNSGEVIGVNFSNFVGQDVRLDSILGKNLVNLVDYILKYTSKKVLFIPHVLWNVQDDRIVCSSLFDNFKNTGRVFLLNSDNYNYCQIRYIISKCDSFIGARTHSVISAYSTCVPALALGYSIKSKGIAKDLGLPESTVIDSIGISSPNEMADQYKVFLKNEDKLRSHLMRVIPEYKSRLRSAPSIISSLFL